MKTSICFGCDDVIMSNNSTGFYCKKCNVQFSMFPEISSASLQKIKQRFGAE